MRLKIEAEDLKTTVEKIRAHEPKTVGDMADALQLLASLQKASKHGLVRTEEVEKMLPYASGERREALRKRIQDQQEKIMAHRAKGDPREADGRRAGMAERRAELASKRAAAKQARLGHKE